MGERKGTNKYYPPDYNPKAGGLNKFLGTHALRERARKIQQGCNNHIGMGVRYNAEKTKVGMYYTTPVYQFKMKCHLCSNHFVIKTDPANLDYLILSGARRQENRWDPLQNEQVVPETKEIQKRLFDDSMFKLEHGVQDVTTAESAKLRLAQLFNRNESVWSDSYSANQNLRKAFRVQTKELKNSAAIDKALLKKSSLDIHLVAETEEDKKYASLLSKKFQSADATETAQTLRKRIIASSCLPSDFTPAKEKKVLKILKEGTSQISQTLVKKKLNTFLSNISTETVKHETDRTELKNIQSSKKNESNINAEPIICDSYKSEVKTFEPSKNKVAPGAVKRLKLTSLVDDYSSGTDTD